MSTWAKILKLRLLFIILIIFLNVLPAISLDQKRGKLENLLPYIGTQQTGEFLNTSPVKNETRKINGQDYEKLLKNLKVAEPISFVNGYYLITGSKKQTKNADTGFFAINNIDKRFYAVISNEKSIKVITNDAGGPRTVDKFVKDWVRSRQQDFNIENVKYEFLY